MKAIISVLSFLLVFSTLGCSQRAESGSTPVLQNRLDLIDPRYHPAKLIGVVNSLRSLGKERAIQEMRDYIAVPHDPMRGEEVVLITRCLFIKPGGWKPAGFGLPWPEKPVKEAIDLFPEYPLAITDGIPFMLIESYKVGGAGFDMGGPALDECEKLKMIEYDMLPFDEQRAKSAADKLIHSKAFEALFLPEGSDDISPSDPPYPEWHGRETALGFIRIQAMSLAAHDALFQQK